MKQLKAAGIHTAVETAANLPWEFIEEVLPWTDLFMMDIKHTDSAKHRWATGVPNERILANARKLTQTGKPIIFRVPVVPTVNDTPDEIAAIAGFVNELNAIRTCPEPYTLELLTFHRLAGDKYRSLELEYQAKDLTPPSKEHMANLVKVGQAAGVAVLSR